MSERRDSKRHWTEEPLDPAILRQLGKVASGEPLTTPEKAKGIGDEIRRSVYDVASGNRQN